MLLCFLTFGNYIGKDFIGEFTVLNILDLSLALVEFLSIFYVQTYLFKKALKLMEETRKAYGITKFNHFSRRYL